MSAKEINFMDVSIEEWERVWTGKHRRMLEIEEIQIKGEKEEENRSKKAWRKFDPPALVVS